MYYSEYKPTCMDKYFGRTSTDEYNAMCIMSPQSQSYEQEKALAIKFCKDNSAKCQPGMWPHMSNSVYKSPSFICREEHQDCYSHHHRHKCHNHLGAGCRNGECSQRSRTKPKHCCPSRYQNDMEKAGKDYPGPGDSSLSVYKHKNGRGLQRNGNTTMKECDLIQTNPSQNCLAILKTKQHNQLKEDPKPTNTENPVQLSTPDTKTSDIADVPMQKPLSNTRLIGYVMFNPENPKSCPYIASLAGIRIFPDKVEQGEHEGWAWSVSEMHNLMNDTFSSPVKCPGHMR